MKLERSLWEEVIKIPLSYRVIKKENIDCQVESEKINTRYDIKEEVVEEGKEEKFIEAENKINLELERNKIIKSLEPKLKEEIETKLRLEIADERKALMEKANLQIEELRARAEKKAIEEGYKKGYEKGYEDGINSSKDLANEIEYNIKEMFNQAEDQVEEYFKANRESIIKLASTMAEAIVNETIDTSIDNLLLLIKPILNQWSGKKNTIIKVSPENINYLKSNLRELEELAPETKFILLEDRLLEKNHCIIENEENIIDLNIREQLNKIVKELSNMG